MPPGRNGTLPLALAAPGQRVRLIEIVAGRRAVHRLAELGLTPGVELEVLQAEGGPLLLAVRDTRLALGQGMALKIRVEALEQEQKMKQSKTLL